MTEEKLVIRYEVELAPLNSNSIVAKYIPFIKSVIIVDTQGERTVSQTEFLSSNMPAESDKLLKDQ